MLQSRRRPDVRLELDGCASLSARLAADVNGLCDQLDEAGPDAIAMIHVVGGHDSARRPCWPGELGSLDVHLVTQWERALRRLERLAGATVGVADGDCGGVALEVLMTTDYRVAGTDLRIVLRGSDGTVWPGMAVYRLANQIGAAQARPYALFGADMSAAQASTLGLVDEVADDIATAIDTFMRSLGGAGGAQLAIRRRLLLEAATTSFEDALGAHLAACDRMMRSAQRLKSAS